MIPVADKVTMQRIATQLKISKVTVSKALNGRPGVSEATRGRIEGMARELGYQLPNKPEASVKRRFGFLVPSRFFLETDKFYTKIFYHLTRHCEADGHTLSLRIVDGHEELVGSHPFADRGTLDGIFVGGEFHEAYLAHVIGGPPLVCLDFSKPRIVADAVVIDNFYASYVATEYLIQKGHRAIGFVGDPAYSENVADRYYGFLKALLEAHLSVPPEWRLDVNDAEGIYFPDVQLPADPPTAWVCHCDLAAYQMLRVLQQRGWSVPGDVSLIGFDNTELSRKMEPPLTSVDINTKAIADEAYRRMVWRMVHRTEPAQRLVLSTRLAERASVRSVSLAEPPTATGVLTSMS